MNLKKWKRSIGFLLAISIGVIGSRVGAEEIKTNETGIFKELGQIDDFNKENPFYIWPKERWSKPIKEDDITFRSTIVEKKNKGTWVFFSCQAFLYDEEGKPRYPLYVEIKYKDTLLKPAKLYSYTGSKKNYGYGEKVALLGGENNNEWKKETYCVKDILVKNNLYSFRIDTHGCVNPLPVASIKVFMKVKSNFKFKPFQTIFNLLSNPSFEERRGWIYSEWEPKGKTGKRGYEGKYDTEVKYKGKRSVYIKNIGETGRAAWYSHPPIEVKENAVYEVSIYIKAENATGGSLTCYFYGPNKSQNFAFDKGTYDWKKYNFSLITPPGTKTIRLYLHNTGKGTFWFDEVSLKEKDDSDKGKTITYKGTTFLYSPRAKEKDPPLSAQIKDKYKKKGYIVYHRKNLRHLYPDSIPQLEEIKESLRNFACPGQYATFWFSIYGLKALNGIKVSLIDDFVSGKGGRIKKENIQLKLIKFWPQRTGWSTLTYYIIPELLEDMPEKINLLEGENQGFWVQIKVPEKTEPGNYRTKLLIETSNSPPSEITLNLKVLPFKLKKPEGIDWVMYASLRQRYSGFRQSNPHRYTDEELKRYLLDMKDYGITGLIVNLYYHEGKTKDGRTNWLTFPYAKKTVNLMKEVGMDGPVVFSAGLQYMVAEELRTRLTTSRWMTYAPELEAPSFQKVYQEKLKKLDEIVKKAGIKNWYYYCVDEPHNANRMPLAIWECKNAQKAGIKTYSTCYPYNSLEKLIPYLNIDTNSFLCKSREDNLRYHQLCKKHNVTLWYLGTGCYTGQEGGLMPNRYQAGFLFYKSGAKAEVSWTYQEIKNSPWTDFDRTNVVGGEYKDACITYPAHNISANKVTISTLQWEGIREGIDDYKYLYTLKEYIKKAKNKGYIKEAENTEKRLNELLESMPWTDTWQCGNSYSNPGNFTNETATKYRWLIATEIMKLQRLIRRER